MARGRYQGVTQADSGVKIICTAPESCVWKGDANYSVIWKDKCISQNNFTPSEVQVLMTDYIKLISQEVPDDMI